MHVGVRLPGVDEHGLPVGERHRALAHRKLRVGAFNLEQHVTMRMRMAHQRTIHVKQCDTAECPMRDAKCSRHLSGLACACDGRSAVRAIVAQNPRTEKRYAALPPLFQGPTANLAAAAMSAAGSTRSPRPAARAF